MNATCTYQIFDSKTLEPTGDESRARIDDLKHIKKYLVGRRVLDIGANSGLVAISAIKWMALHVTAVDVNKDLVTALQEVARAHSLPLTASVCAFNDLDVNTHRSEIVICLEVIHWLVHQGNSAEKIVAKLDELTGAILFLETPWDKTEKSIQARMNEHLDGYSLPKFFELFLARGFRIEVLAFTTYFNDQSRRVLLKLDRM
jgi:2-polyprenyl-3-methyl-5-hydroxy-6-metoxy-1,4-benzoquinol methylase